MKAAVLEGVKNITIKDVKVPELQDGQIEIKVSAVGVCGSVNCTRKNRQQNLQV